MQSMLGGKGGFVGLYLHGDGALFGHRLVHSDEGHVVVEVIDGALERSRETGRTGSTKTIMTIGNPVNSIRTFQMM